jgi:hypothetical protein
VIMNNQKLVKGKIPSIRTFASDQKNNQASAPDQENVKVVSNINDEVPTIKEALTSIPIPPAKKEATPSIKLDIPKPEVKQEHIVADSPVVKPLDSTKRKPESKRSHITIDGENASSATVITDTKKDRFKLFPAIIKSVKSWFEELKLARKTRKTPKYTVPETTRRKGIIQKATSKTGKFAAADHSMIYKKIRERRDRDKKSKSTSFWTPNTEAGFPLLEETTAPTNVQVTPRKSFITKHQEIIITDLKKNKTLLQPIVKAETEPKTMEREDKNVPTETSDTGPTWDTYAKTEPKSTPIPPLVKEPQTIEKEEKPEPFEPTTPVVTQPKVAKPIKKVSEDKDSSSSLLLKTNTNALSFGVFGLLIAITLVSTAGYLWYKSENKSILTPIEYPSLINTPLTTIHLPNYTKESILSALENHEENTESNVTQFIFTFNDSTTPAIPPGTLFTEFNIILDVGFFESVTSLYFGKVNNAYPFLALKVSDQTTARGGILAWEKNMRRDLGQIFDLNNSTSTNKFIDAMQSGVDVRILKSSNGEEEIIYGFINKNTIIITTNKTAMGRLSELAK